MLEPYLIYGLDVFHPRECIYLQLFLLRLSPIAFVTSLHVDCLGPSFTSPRPCYVDVLMIVLLLTVPFSLCPIDCHGSLLQLDDIFPVSTHVLLCIPHHPLPTRTSTLSFSHSHALRSSFVFLYERKEMFL